MIVNVRITSDVDRVELAVDDSKTLKQICLEENLGLTTTVYVNGELISASDAEVSLSELPLNEGLNLIAISNKPNGGY